MPASPLPTIPSSRLAPPADAPRRLGPALGAAAAIGWAHGALLYGGLVALLTVIHNQPLDPTPAEALVVLAVCLLLYGAVHLVVFVAVSGAAWLAGRPPRGAPAPGLGWAACVAHAGFGILVVDYGLTYGEVPWGEPSRSGMVAWLALRALLVALAAAVAAGALVGALRRLGPRRLAAAGLALLAAWAIALLAAVAWPRTFEAPPPLARVPSTGPGRPVVLLGIDGADWRVIEPLLAAGRLPHLAALIAAGASGPLASYPDANSAVLWATMYSGYPPATHRVLDFYTLRFPGLGRGLYPVHRTGLKEMARQLQRLGLASIVPIDRSDTAAPLLWEIAALGGRRTGVVDGYYYSFPAPPLPGEGYFLAYGAERFAKAEGGGTAAARQRAAALYARPPELLAETAAALEGEEMEWQTAALLELLERRGQPAFLSLYTHQPDAVQHWTWRFLEPDRFFGVTPEEARDRNDIEEVHLSFDRFLGDLLPRLDPRTVVVIASDHGHSPTLVHAMDTQHRHGPPGILVLAGPGIRPGDVAAAGVYDLAPTLLHLLGLPVAADFPGRVLAEVLEGGGGVARVPSYRGLEVPGAGGAAAADPARADDEIEKLRALGYIR